MNPKNNKEQKYKDGRKKPILTPEQKKAQTVERVKAQTLIQKQLQDETKEVLTAEVNVLKTVRHTKYTETERNDKFNKIIDTIETGESLYKALIKHRLQAHTFYNWIDNNPKWLQSYARAYARRFDALFDKAVDIALDVSIPVDRARLIIDTVKWVCSKGNPQKYSEKQNIQIIGAVNHNTMNLTGEARDAKINELLNKLGVTDVNFDIVTEAAETPHLTDNS